MQRCVELGIDAARSAQTQYIVKLKKHVREGSFVVKKSLELCRAAVVERSIDVSMQVKCSHKAKQKIVLVSPHCLEDLE